MRLCKIYQPFSLLLLNVTTTQILYFNFFLCGELQLFFNYLLCVSPPIVKFLNNKIFKIFVSRILWIEKHMNFVLTFCRQVLSKYYYLKLFEHPVTICIPPTEFSNAKYVVVNKFHRLLSI